MSRGVEHTMERAIELGPVQARLKSGTELLFWHDVESVFATAPADPARIAWTITTHLGCAEEGLVRDPWRAHCQHSPDTQQTWLRSLSPRALTTATYDVLRAVLGRYWQQRGATPLQASAVVDDEQLMLIVGGPATGKTTLAINGALSAGKQFVGDDTIWLYHGVHGPTVAALPGWLSVPAGTICDYRDRLGPGLGTSGFDPDAVGRLTPSERYQHPGLGRYTARDLGGTPVVGDLPLAGRRVLVVLASYAAPDQPVSLPVTVPTPQAASALWPHTVLTWPSEDQRGSHQVSASARSADAARSAAARNLGYLAARADVVRWAHHGSLAPLASVLPAGS